MWKMDPVSNDWNTAKNWNPETVPDRPPDVATFGGSSRTSISLSRRANVAEIVFSPMDTVFTIGPEPGVTLTISGAGITNYSGATQNLVTSAASGLIGLLLFSRHAGAGDRVTITNRAAVGVYTYGGQTAFSDHSTAGTGTFINEGGALGGNIGGFVSFDGSASAGNGTFIGNGGTTQGSRGGLVIFVENATADHGTFMTDPSVAIGAYGGAVELLGNSIAADATFINNGGSISDAGGGATAFYAGSQADNCTLIANPGTNGGGGGEIWFFANSVGGSPRVEVFGNGFLDVSNNGTDVVAIGSLEGNGVVVLGVSGPAVGTNNLNTEFSGTIKDSWFASGGMLTKVGFGTLTLSGASSYVGGAVVSGGTLRVNNTSGSGTGSGAVQVVNGKLGGNGIIAGPVTIGTGGTNRAGLDPGVDGPGLFTIQNMLTFGTNGSYHWNLNAETLRADEVVAAGVTINIGARFLVGGRGGPSIPVGTAFTAIGNTATSPISGTFSNLPDGGTIRIGRNTLQANYAGGDGNDLILTVVQRPCQTAGD